MGRAIGAWVLLVLAACNNAENGGGDGGGTGTGSDMGMLTCKQLQQRITGGLAALDRSCDTVADCELFGAASRGFTWTCDCAPYLAERCTGDSFHQGAIS